jgi:hypothetical protein
MRRRASSWRAARLRAAGILLAFAFAVTAVAGAGARPSDSRPQTSTAKVKKTSARSKSHKRSRYRRSRRQPFQKAPTPDRIREIQTALQRNGYYKGDPSGKWDATTVDAMERFQQDHALSPSGKIDALSLQKLGLGSEIAGVSAPQPMALSGQNAPKTETAPTPNPNQNPNPEK